MYNNIDSLLNNFDLTANASVKLIYNDFLNSIQNIDRLNDEHTIYLRFQHCLDKLKQRLEGKAREYISENQNILTIDWFQKKIIYIIKCHMQEFSQMVRLA